MKPSIYCSATRLWTGDCLSLSPFQKMYVRAAAERYLSGTLLHLLLLDAPNHAFSMEFSM